MSQADEELIQGTEEWRRARAGSLGAASLHEALARLKSGAWAASRANLKAALISERLTGIPWNGYRSPAMMWGTEQEPHARAAYAAKIGAAVREVGIVRHPNIEWAHASPDGWVGDNGLIEIKCPNTATHVEWLSGGRVPDAYMTQMQWQLACTGRQWCDFVSFDPRVAPALQLLLIRVLRDGAEITRLEKEARVFLAEIEDSLALLENEYGDITPPPIQDWRDDFEAVEA